MTRREIRDSAFKIIYEKLLRDDSLEDLYEMAEEVEEISVRQEDFQELLKLTLRFLGSQYTKFFMMIKLR